MDLNLDIGDVNGALGINDIARPIDSTGPWQVSAFAFLGVIVVIGIFLHFVAETSSGGNSINKSSNSNRGSSKSRASRPYQYRRRQRQRRMQKLRKKKTDEWSDDEEPVQNGARLLPTFGTGGGRTGNGSFDDDYGSPDHPYAFDYNNDYRYENDYESENHNRSAYHQSDYYQEPNSYLSSQDISHRRTGNTRDSYDYYSKNNLPPTPIMGNKGMAGSATGVVPTYKSPAASKYLMESTSPAKMSASAFRSATSPQRGISPMNSYSSGGSGSIHRQWRKQPNINYSSNDSSPIWEMEKNGNQIGNSRSIKNEVKNSSNGITVGSALSWQHERDDANHFPDDSVSFLQQPTLTTASKDRSVDDCDLGLSASNRPAELGARPLDSGSRFSSFASISDMNADSSQELPNISGEGNIIATQKDSLASREKRETNEAWSRASGGGYMEFETFDASPVRAPSSQNSLSSNQNIESPVLSIYDQSFSSINSQRQQDLHQRSLLLTPGNCEQTPIIGNARKTIEFNNNANANLDEAALLPISGALGTNDVDHAIPYVPQLKKGHDVDTGLSPLLISADPPPRSIIMDELRLQEMETGSSTNWNTELSESSNHEDFASFAGECGDNHLDRSAAELDSSGHGSASYGGSDISIPSGDPRKSIHHKRQNLTMSTDAATSLQCSIDFEELQLQEVIGGGGFGQVWKATWRGTPVAVKVLTGSAQNTHIAKAILEEFKAEINLLSGMRHPNICLYMGASLTPPNRAIVTELAANGSAWDSLRLPLMPPYSAADGSPNGSWPLSLYLPGQHGIPPSSNGSSLSSRISAPIPPRGTWPWELVKRVSCGAARGMAYLHSGNPPILHRDLKSANLLLDESYTTKVCDFGLSRLKAQSRSMTANCGTVQWMAPEVLANRSYDEKADVYSFGIIVWELLSRECPYEGMTAIQCALAVLNRDKRPDIPKWCPPGLHALIKSCIKKDPSDRPTFAEIIIALDGFG